MGYNRVVKKREYAALLLLAGGNRRLHPLVVSHSRFTACALRNPSVDDPVTDLLIFGVHAGRIPNPYDRITINLASGASEPIEKPTSQKDASSGLRLRSRLRVRIGLRKLVHGQRL